MNKYLTSLLLWAALSLGISSQAQTTAESDIDAKYATEMLKQGTRVPEIKLKTLDGKDFKLSKLRGHYVVLDFWAAWCGDCRRDAPTLARLYKEYKDKGVEFVGISMDTDPKAWAACVEKYGLTYHQVGELVRFKESAVAKAYGVKWLPSMYLLDPKGRVVLATVMSEKLEKKLQEVIK